MRISPATSNFVAGASVPIPMFPLLPYIQFPMFSQFEVFAVLVTLAQMRILKLTLLFVPDPAPYPIATLYAPETGMVPAQISVLWIPAHVSPAPAPRFEFHCVLLQKSL